MRLPMPRNVPPPWEADDVHAAMIASGTARAHVSLLHELVQEDPDGWACTGEPREVFARDTMEALDATVAQLREALGVAPGFSGAER